MFQPEIQRYPLGLPDFFELKSGQTPRFLAEQIVPVVELGELYLINDRISTGVATINVAAPGYGTFPELTVPPGQIWYVWAFSVVAAAVLTAGQTVHARSVARLGQSGTIARSPRASATAGEIWNTEAVGPFWLGPGGGLGYCIEGLAAGPIPVGAQCVYTALQV
jgi:hypothetical protein